MDMQAEAKYRRGQMASRVKQELDEVLDQQEKKAIAQVMTRLNSGEVLDPQFAIQQWLELYSVHRFRRVLSQREREGVSAGSKVVAGAETIGKQRSQ